MALRSKGGFGRGGGFRMPGRGGFGSKGESNNPLEKLFNIKKIWIAALGLLLGVASGALFSPLIGVFVFLIFASSSSASVSSRIQEYLEENEDPRVPQYADAKKTFKTLRTLDCFKRFSPVSFRKPFAVTRSYTPPPKGLKALIGTGCGSKPYNPSLPFLKLKFWPPNRISFWAALISGALAAVLHYVLLMFFAGYIDEAFDPVLYPNNAQIEPFIGGLIATFPGVAGTFVGGFLLVAAFAETSRWTKQDMPESTEDEPNPLPGYIMGALSVHTLRAMNPVMKYDPPSGVKQSIRAKSSVPVIFQSEERHTKDIIIAASAGLACAGGAALFLAEEIPQAVWAAGVLGVGVFVLEMLRRIAKIVKKEMRQVYEDRKKEEEKWEEMWSSLPSPTPPVPGWIRTQTVDTGYMVRMEESHFAIPEGVPMSSYQKEKEIASVMKAAGAVTEGTAIQGKRMVITSADIPQYLALFTTKSGELGNIEMQPHLRTWELPENQTAGASATPAALFALRTALREGTDRSSLPSLILLEAYQYHKSSLPEPSKKAGSSKDQKPKLPPAASAEPVVWRMECSSRGKTLTLKEIKQRQERLAKSLQCSWMRINEDANTGRMEIWFSNMEPENMVLKDEQDNVTMSLMNIPGGSPTTTASELREMVVRMDWTEIIYRVLGDMPSGYALLEQKCEQQGGQHRFLAEATFKPMLDQGKLIADLPGRLGSSFLYIENMEDKNATRISWGVNIDTAAYLDPTESEQVRTETLINAFRKHWMTSKSSTLPEITEIVFHRNDKGLDLMEIRCLPGGSKPLADLKINDLNQCMNNMAVKWMRIGQQSEGGDSFGYSVVVSQHKPSAESLDMETETGKWIYALDRVWGMAEKMPALYGLVMEDVRALDKSGSLRETRWSLPAGVASYKISKALSDVAKEYSTPVAIPGEQENSESFYIVFGREIPMDQKKWLSSEDQEQVNKWGWQNMMRICEIETQDHQVPEITETKIVGRTTKHTLKLPPGLSPDQLHTDREKMRSTGKYLYLEIGKARGDMIDVICAYEDPLPDMVLMPELHPRRAEWSKIPLGVGVKYRKNPQQGYSNFVLEWDLKLSPHMLLCGTTGSGKSSAIRVIAAEAVARGFVVFIVDAVKQGGDFAPFAEHEYFSEETAWDLENAHQLISKAYKRGKQRLDYMTDYGYSFWADMPADIRPRPELLIIDECFSMLAASPAQTPDGKKENEMKAEILGFIMKIARESRSAGLHMVVTAQRPDAKVIQGETKNNLACRVILGSADATARQMVLTTASTAPDPGRDMPKGRGVFEQTGSDAEVIHSFYAGNDQELLSNMCGVFNKIWVSQGRTTRLDIVL